MTVLRTVRAADLRAEDLILRDGQVVELLEVAGYGLEPDVDDPEPARVEVTWRLGLGLASALLEADALVEVPA